MSAWTYITGIVQVSPMGRTNAERKYILETVVNHLPTVNGSEGPMYVQIVQLPGHNMSSSHDELGRPAFRNYNYDDGWIQDQSDFNLILTGNLRDRFFEETFLELQKWLCRLAKRVCVEDMIIKLSGLPINDKQYHMKEIILKDHEPYRDMWEEPTWVNDEKTECSEPNWCEYLMWDADPRTGLPVMLEYKYYSDQRNDVEAERRIQYWRGNE